MLQFRSPDNLTPFFRAVRPYARATAMGFSRVDGADSESWQLWVVKLLPVLAFLVVPHGTGFAVGDDPETRHTLGGQRGVHVVVEPFSLDIKREHFTREQLRADVEKLLRTACITVLTAEQAEKQPGKPALHVRVMLTRDSRHRLYVVHIGLAFQQEVALVRNAAVRIIAPTWRAEGVGTVAEDQLRTIRQDVGTYVEDFIRDYLIMSPLGAKEPVAPSSHSTHPRSRADKP